MKFSDVKTLLLSSGYMKTSDSGGREVVDEFRDASFERNHQTFAGSDRPEFHKTLAGFEQVAVEKETTNGVGSKATGSLIFEGDWIAVGGADVTVTQGHGINGVTENGATRIQTVGGTSFLKYRINDVFESSYLGVGITSVWVNNIGSEPVRFFVDRFGTAPSGSANQTISAGETKKVVLGGSESVDGGKNILFGTISGEESKDLDFIAFQPQPEKSAYPTLFTEGTRLAPSPVIENALPETGTIGVVGEFFRTEGVTDGDRILYTPLGSSIRTSLYRGSIQSVRFYYKGGGGVSILNIESFEENRRNLFATFATYTLSEAQVFVLIPNGKVYKSSVENINPADDLRNDLNMGTSTSQRFEKPLHKDEIVRVNASDEEIKQFFEDLTRGTSMETAKEDMVIV